jgi:predicted nucleic acid-binding protein
MGHTNTPLDHVLGFVPHHTPVERPFAARGGSLASRPMEYVLKRYAHRPQLQQDLKAFLQMDAKPLSVTRRVMEQYARIRIALRNTQGPHGQRLGLIGDTDTIIAATAMVHNLTLITSDIDPLRVPNLATWHIPPGQLR